MSDLFGFIEAGGTKFILGVGHAPDTILRTARVPTTTPAETIGAALAFFAQAEAELGSYAGFGIASFGPVDVDPASPTWGHITQTPKPGWSGADMVGPFTRRFGCSAGFDTDVNGALLAEWHQGAAMGADIATYVTVGTGIGGGAIVQGELLHGLRHPEMGHARPERHPDDREFAGTCRFHGGCLEGLASGPAVKARWGASLSELPADHPGHRIIGHYLGQLVVWQQALLSPRRIVFGGGVMDTPGLIDHVREAASDLAQGYFGVDRAGYDALVVPTALGGNAGLLGALALASRCGSTGV
ncbi:ROK family protein [Sphingomonas sp. 37zxx]|uniref:ROK family protein n=1 Tax=Sphingomonas sp. 37zxx TaxID=1550073 RepID=UPI00053C01E1|nr:ROK family protein [Sphingomonas sp. 37zxx]